MEAPAVQVQGARKPGRRVQPWQTHDLREHLSGTRPEEELRQSDHRGLTPIAAAAMQAATTSQAILDTLVTAGEEGEDPLAQLLDAMERLAERQAMMDMKLDRLIELLALPAAPAAG